MSATKTVWQLFTVCTGCKRLCPLSSNSKCKNCTSDYQRARQHVLASRSAGGTLTYAQALRMVEDDGRKNWSMDVCSVCGEPLRGYKHDEIPSLGVVCPYDAAEYNRLRQLPVGAYRLLLKMVERSRLYSAGGGVPDPKAIEEAVAKMRPNTSFDDLPTSDGGPAIVPYEAGEDEEEPSDEEILAERRAAALAYLKDN